MENQAYEKLLKAASEHDTMSITVCEAGNAPHAISVPWERTVSAMNMKLPKLALTPEELQRPEIIDALQHCRLNGFYSYVPLKNYSFLSGFTEMEDLCIRRADHMHDLSFVKNMPDLFMLFLRDAHLPDLKPLMEQACSTTVRLQPGKCYGFCNCTVDDLTDLNKSDCYFSELLVWLPDGDTRERWKPGRRPGYSWYGSMKHD